MKPEWMVGLLLAAFAGLVISIRIRKSRAAAKPLFENEREEQLTKRVAAKANCSLSAALGSVRQELGFSPQQTDDVLVKRAVYHYHQANPPEHRVTYCDTVRG